MAVSFRCFKWQYHLDALNENIIVLMTVPFHFYNDNKPDLFSNVYIVDKILPQCVKYCFFICLPYVPTLNKQLTTFVLVFWFIFVQCLDVYLFFILHPLHFNRYLTIDNKFGSNFLIICKYLNLAQNQRTVL